MEKIIFVYNANSGLLNGLRDLFHKNLSPKTYACRLCAITYDNFGMLRGWKEFIQALNIPSEFLHRNELKEQYGIEDITLPTALLKVNDVDLQIWISADEMNQCQSLNDLKTLIQKKLNKNVGSL